MKKLKQLTAVFLTVIMALGVLTVAPFTVSAAGNTINTASSYNIGNTAYGSITSSNSNDYYKFTLSSSGKISLNVNAYIRRSTYFIYDVNHSEVWRSTDIYWNDTTELMILNENINLTSGTYYFLVAKSYDNSTGNYNFKINFSSANENFKETTGGTNNNFSNTNPISLNTRYNGQIANNDNKDYYKFTLSNSGKIALNVNAYIRRSTYFIYDANHSEVWRSTDIYWNDTTELMILNENINLTSGTYYFLVAKSYDNSTGNYNFKINFSSANENFKETTGGTNNNFSNTNPISLNTRYNGQIANNDDKDYYKFTLSNSGKIALNINAYIRRSTYFIYDVNYREIWKSTDRYWNDSTEVMILNENINLTSGTYYFLVAKSYDNSTGNYNFSISQSITPTSIRLNQTSLILGTGESYTLTKSVYPSNASTSYTWSSSNTSVATVSNGKVTAKKSGTAYITVKTSNGKTAQCKVTVKPAPTSVKTNPASVTLGVGEKYTISESTNSGTYANASNLKWSTSNSSVATVTKGSGNKATVTAKGVGTAYVKITLYNGKTATCKVTVKPAPTSVKTNPASVTLGVGEKYTISESTNSGTYANASNLKWSTSNSSVATVTKGSGNKATVTAKGVGTAYVKITLYNGKTAQCKVTVKPAPTSVKSYPASVTLGKGENYTIAAGTNSGSWSTTYTWSSSNNSVATVTGTTANKAKITAKGTGTATITIRTFNGKTTTCKVTVKSAPSSVKVNPSNITLKKGASYTISESTNSGTYANADNLKWSTSNSSVATVTKGNGNKATITAKSKGTAYIKITLYNGKTAQCKVTVK